MQESSPDRVCSRRLQMPERSSMLYNCPECSKPVTVNNLNKHLLTPTCQKNRINPEHHPACKLCLHPFETVEHFLFQCQGLQHLRDFYLPTDPDPANTLYASTEQLKRTSTFFTMANGRRAQAQVAAGSEK